MGAACNGHRPERAQPARYLNAKGENESHSFGDGKSLNAAKSNTPHPHPHSPTQPHIVIRLYEGGTTQSCNAELLVYADGDIEAPGSSV